MMRGWIASLPLRWLVFLLTTWCLNSDAVEAMITHSGGRDMSVAAVASAPNSTTTIGAFHIPRSHEARIRERCACHRGTVLPTGLAAEALKQLPSFVALVADLDRLLSVTAPPDLPPPRL